MDVDVIYIMLILFITVGFVLCTFFIVYKVAIISGLKTK